MSIETAPRTDLRYYLISYDKDRSRASRPHRRDEPGDAQGARTMSRTPTCSS